MSINTAIACRVCKQMRVYRKVAWAIEDLEQDVGLTYRLMERTGLECSENVGPRLAEVVEDLLLGWLTRPTEAKRRWLEEDSTWVRDARP